MAEQQAVTMMVLDDELTLTLGEVCRYCKLSTEQVTTLVEEGIIEAQGTIVQEWRFSGSCVKRIRIAQRLQQDLEVNLPGVAIILELLEELATLRR